MKEKLSLRVCVKKSVMNSGESLIINVLLCIIKPGLARKGFDQLSIDN